MRSSEHHTFGSSSTGSVSASGSPRASAAVRSFFAPAPTGGPGAVGPGAKARVPLSASATPFVPSGVKAVAAAPLAAPVRSRDASITLGASELSRMRGMRKRTAKIARKLRG